MKWTMLTSSLVPNSINLFHYHCDKLMKVLEIEILHFTLYKLRVIQTDVIVLLNRISIDIYTL